MNPAHSLRNIFRSRIRSPTVPNWLAIDYCCGECVGDFGYAG